MPLRDAFIVRVIFMLTLFCHQVETLSLLRQHDAGGLMIVFPSGVYRVASSMPASYSACTSAERSDRLWAR